MLLLLAVQIGAVERYSDPDWLQYFALNIHTALDYFARSSFYDFACNNEIIRQRGLDLSKLA